MRVPRSEASHRLASSWAVAGPSAAAVNRSRSSAPLRQADVWYAFTASKKNAGDGCGRSVTVAMGNIVPSANGRGNCVRLTEVLRRRPAGRVLRAPGFAIEFFGVPTWHISAILLPALGSVMVPELQLKSGLV